MPDRKLIIFDFDGTIVDSLHIYTEIAKDFSDQHGMTHDDEKLVAGYTKPHLHDLGWGIPLEKQAGMLAILDDYHVEQIKDHKRYLPELFDGMHDVLENLSKQYDLAIVTVNTRKVMNAILSHHNLHKYFPVTRTLCCTKDRNYDVKPSPDAARCVLHETGHQEKDTIIVGDSVSDIGMANALGVKSIAALWDGRQPIEKLQAANPTLIVRTVKELPNAIENLFTANN